MAVVKHNVMRQANLLTLLAGVSRYGPIAKRDLQQKTGMSWGSVSTLTGELLEQGILSEEMHETGGVGRTPTLLDISKSHNLTIGIDINIEGIAVVLIDLKCRVLYQKHYPAEDPARDAILEQVKQAVQAVLDAGYTVGQLLGIGVAMQGSVDAQNGVSRYAPYFEGWREVPLRQMLEDAFGLPVVVLHDPECMALAERWVGCAREVDDFLLVRASTGIGMGLFLGGQVYSGHEGAAGELGHLVVQPGGEPCGCGGRGCLEMYASVRGILHRAGRLAGSPPTHNLSGLAFDARHGKEPARALFDDAGTYLGVALSGLVNLLNPKMIVLSGTMMEYEDLLLEKVRQVLADSQWKYASVELRVSHIESSAAIGAALFYIQEVFAGRRALLPA